MPFVTAYGFVPSVRNLSRCEVEIGLLVCLNMAKAQNILEVATGITASMDSNSFLSVMQMSGVSDRDLQKQEIAMIKQSSK